MDSLRIKPSEILNKFQLSEIRQKSDMRNIIALLFDWGMMALGISLFYLFPFRLPFLSCFLPQFAALSSLSTLASFLCYPLKLMKRGRRRGRRHGRRRRIKQYQQVIGLNLKTNLVLVRVANQAKN